MTIHQNGGIFGHAGQGAPSMLTWPMACYHVDGRPTSVVLWAYRPE